MGSNFSPGVTAMLIVSGSPVSLTIVSSTTTIIDCTVPSEAAGAYDLILTNTDGRSQTFTGAISFVAATSNAAVAAMNIFGINVVGLYANEFTLNGSAVASWIDQSGMGNHALQATGADQPAYLASDSTFNSQPSVAGNGSNYYLECASFQLDSSGCPTAILSVMSAPGTGIATDTLVSVRSNNGNLLQLTSANKPVCATQSTATWGSAISGAQNVDSLVTPGTGGSGVASINVADGTAVTASASVSNFTSGAAMYLFSNTTVQYGSMKAACIVILNVIPNSTQLSNWHTFCQSFFGTT
jgi:hypothetical protein